MASFKIQTLNNIASSGLDEFPRELYEIDPDKHQPDALLVRSYKMHDMVFEKQLKVVGRAGAGTNNIPVSSLTAMGIPVLNTPGANANAVKELVIAGMLIAARNIISAAKFTDTLRNEHSDQHINQMVEANKKHYAGFELAGKTLGVVGMGKIGIKVANTALQLGMKVVAYDPSITTSNAWQVSSDVVQAHSLDELLRQARFLTFHVPLCEETRHMIGADRLKIMPKNAVILNFARDGILDNTALFHALESKHIAAYISDFPNATLMDLPNVLHLPHLGASTREAEEKCAVMVARQVREYLEHGNIKNSVNFPDTFMPRSSGFRLAIANRNIPNMVAEISTILSHAGLNILDLLNKSRGEVAYSLIDVDQNIQDETVAALERVDGILKVRRIVDENL